MTHAIGLRQARRGVGQIPLDDTLLGILARIFGGRGTKVEPRESSPLVLLVYWVHSWTRTTRWSPILSSQHLASAATSGVGPPSRLAPGIAINEVGFTGRHIRTCSHLATALARELGRGAKLRHGVHISL